MTVPEKSTKNFSIRLNSEGLCFICLRDTKANGDDHAPPTSFRLRNIARFLGIDTKKILKAYLDYDLKRCSDVKVELCEGCSEQVKKFNCLYQTLELTKLKLNECVRKISSLIKEAEEECDPDRTGEMERRVTHTATRGVIVDLRAGISEKCLAFSESLPPRLILKRLPESELAKFFSRKTLVLDSHPTPIKIEVSGEDDECRSFIDSDTAAVSEMGDFDTESVNAQEQRKTGTVFDFKALSKSCRRGGRLWCPFCKAVFLVEHQHHLHSHLVNYHLQSFFFPEEEYKEPSLSSHQFIQIVHHLLFKYKSTSHPVTTESVSRCPYCTEAFAKKSLPSFKLHILKNHKVPLIQKLNTLQTVPTLFKQLSKITNTWLCKCGVYCSNAMLHTFHRNKLCNLIGKPERDGGMTPAISKSLLEIEHQQIKFSKSADGTLRASCPYCRAVFVDQRMSSLKNSMEKHLTGFHLHTFFHEEDLKEPSLSSHQFQQVIYHHLFANISTDPRNPNLLKCPDCSATVPKDKLSKLKMHVIKFHYESLLQSFKDLQKNSTILSKLSKISKEYICNCGAYCSKAMLYHMHRSKYCNLIETTPTNAEMSPELLKQNAEVVHQQTTSSISKSADGTLQALCSHCRAVFKSKLSKTLNVLTWEHLVRRHLHTFFPEDKHKDPSLSSVQFKQVINHLLFESLATTDANVKTKENYYKCPHCKVTILKSNVARFKVHLIKSHYQSLVHRLEELQKDALIFEKLGKIHEALICECGTHFEFRKSFELHQQKFCNLNSVLVEASTSRGIDSSTCSTERDPLASEDEDNNDHLSDSEDMNSIEFGEVKPNISTETNIVVREIRAPERKRRGWELDSELSSSETNCIPEKEIKLENCEIFL